MTHRKVTISQFAAELGISRQAAHRGVKRCAIPIDADGLLDLQAGLALYRSLTRARVKTRRAAEPPSGVVADDPQAYEVSRAQRECAEARIAELTLGRLNGTLLERSAVERGAFAAARGLREALEGSAGQIAAAVSGLPPGESERVVRRMHKQLLEDFQMSIAKMIGPPPAVPAPQ